MPKTDKDLPSAVELLENKTPTRILKRSWLREGLEDVVLELGGPQEFLKQVWQREPKEFIKLVGKLLPQQLEVPPETNLIVMDGGFRLINKELTTPPQELPPGPIEVDFEVINEKTVENDPS